MAAYGSLLAWSLLWFVFSGFLGHRLIGRVARLLPAATQLWFWLAGLYALLFSALTSVVCLGILIWNGWATSSQASHGPEDLGYLFLVSVLPYLALALLGALFAAAFTKLQPAIEAAKETSELLKLSSTEHTTFEGIQVRVLETQLLVAALVEISRTPIILVTRGALDALNTEEIKALYWHEVGHGIGEHNGLTRIARFASTLLPWLPFARESAAAVRELCEKLADKFAAERVGLSALESAHSKFTF